MKFLPIVIVLIYWSRRSKLLSIVLVYYTSAVVVFGSVLSNLEEHMELSIQLVL